MPGIQYEGDDDMDCRTHYGPVIESSPGWDIFCLINDLLKVRNDQIVLECIAHIQSIKHTGLVSFGQ